MKTKKIRLSWHSAGRLRVVGRQTNITPCNMSPYADANQPTKV
jgi:hypothetical protein